MRIQYFNGGLANQVFQYIFLRYAELSAPGQDAWFLDDSFFFFKNEHNGYELEKVFGIKANLLSDQFGQEAWNVLIENRKNGIGLPQSLMNMGFPVQMIAEASNYKSDNPFTGPVHTIPCNEYHPEILKVPGEIIYYFGYWINKNWINTYKDQILSELSFPPILDPINQKYATQIKSSLSVGVHIRRGDYVSYGWQLDNTFYKNSCQALVDQYPELHFFVFSDDIPWCQEKADELGLSLAKDVTFVQGNMNGANYIDLQLMSMCKGLLMSNSAFCFLAALMDQNLQFYINPTPWRAL